MRVSIYNIGCKLNFAEISEIQKQFEQEGHQIVDFDTPADLVMLNTCTVTNQADKDSRKYIRRAIRKNPNAFIAVMGCYSQLKPDEVKEIEGVDLILGTNNKFDIKQLITNFEKRDNPQIFVPDLEDAPFHFASSVENTSRTRVVFKIQDGCDYVCTYCTIPMARGKSRSMDFNELKSKFIELNNSEYHEVVLSGINLGEYRSTTGEKFADVLRFIADNDFNYRVRISSIEPNLVTDEIIEIVKGTENICSHFHIPLQSGSANILKKMKRRYNKTLYKNRINKIIEEIPNCGIGADVIEGFPGETDDEFQETYDFINSLAISYLHVFSYSDRELAAASKYDSSVPHDIRKERTKKLRELSDLKKSEFIKSQIGLNKKFIPETIVEKKFGYMIKGWTENYIPSQLISDNIIKEPVKVRVVSEKHLTGELELI